MYFILLFFFKQKTAYEMRISDWSSDVCSSDLIAILAQPREDEGIAPRICRDIDVLDQLALVIDVGVHALVEAHQRQRDGIVPGSENDRERALRIDELVGRQRNCVGCPEELGILEILALPGDRKSVV